MYNSFEYHGTFFANIFYKHHLFVYQEYTSAKKLFSHPISPFSTTTGEKILQDLSRISAKTMRFHGRFRTLQGGYCQSEDSSSEPDSFPTTSVISAW